MMLKRRRKEDLPERRDPGEPEPEPCAPGSIEQQLDMCEDGTLRGDDILHRHGRISAEPVGDEDPRPLDELAFSEDHFEMDLSAEPDREGDEMSGDEHSSGLEGGELGTGIPGEETREQSRTEEEQRKRPEEPSAA